MSTRRARVVVAYATVKVLDPISGKPAVAGFYKGAIFPPEADAENVASLVRREYAEWLDKDEGEAVEKQETDVVEAQQAAAQQRAEESEAAAKKADELAGVEPEKAAGAGRPHGNAGKAAWVDYAVAQRDEGVSEEDARAEAESSTRDELVARYGKRPSAQPAGPPSPSASKEAWVDYAVSRRAEDVSEDDARAEAEAKTRTDLVAEFGG